MVNDGKTSNKSKMSIVNNYSFDEALEQGGYGWFQLKLLIVTGWIYAIEAFELLKAAFIVPILRHIWNLTMWESNMIGISLFTGNAVGCFVWSKLSDIYGRRKTIMCATAIVAFFGFATGLTTNIITFTICTFLMSSAHSGVVAGTLLQEFSPKNWRARSMVMYEIFWMLGGIWVVLLSWLILPNFDLQLGWRIFTFVSAISASVVALLALFIPESVRYLCTVGDFDNATKLIERFLKTNGAELMKGRLDRNKIVDKRGAFGDLFLSKYRLTTIAVMLNYFTFGVVYYGAIFISRDLFIHTSLYLCELIITKSELPAIPISCLIDKTGRKGMMVITMVINTICLSIAAFLWYRDKGYTWLTYLNVVLIFSSRCSSHVYVTALGTFITEYYPTAIRTTGFGFLRAIGRSGGIVGIFLWLDLDIVTGLTTMAILCLLSLPNHLLLEDTTNKAMSNAVDYGDSKKKVDYYVLY